MDWLIIQVNWQRTLYWKSFFVQKFIFFIAEFVMLLSKDSKKSSSKGKNKKLRTKKPHRSGEAKTKDITGKSTTQANANMNNLKTVSQITHDISTKLILLKF